MAEPSAATFAGSLRLRTDADLTPSEPRMRA
jgi:hypothetical protein